MTVCCLWCSSGPITMTATAEKKAFVPGNHTPSPPIHPSIHTYSLINIVSSFLQVKLWKSFATSVILHLGWLLQRWNCNRSRHFSDQTTNGGELSTKPWHPYLDVPSTVTPLMCTLSSSSQYLHLHRPPSLTAASCTWIMLLRLVKQTDGLMAQSASFIQLFAGLHFKISIQLYFLNLYDIQWMRIWIINWFSMNATSILISCVSS